MKHAILSLLATGTALHGAITSAILNPSRITMYEGESLSVTLTATCSYNGPGEGIYEILGSVHWGILDPVPPPAQIAEGATFGFPKSVVVGSTGDITIPDEGTLHLSFSGYCAEVSWEEWIPGYLTGAPTYVTNTNSPTVEVLNLAPTIIIGQDNVTVNGLVNGLVNFFAYATDPGLNDVLTYRWDLDGNGDFSDASGSSTPPIDFSGYAPGVYHAMVRVDDGDGGVDTDTFDITVVPEPGAMAILALTPLLGLRRRRRGLNHG
jgi:hypothetical protein